MYNYISIHYTVLIQIVSQQPEKHFAGKEEEKCYMNQNFTHPLVERLSFASSSKMLQYTILMYSMTLNVYRFVQLHVLCY